MVMRLVNGPVFMHSFQSICSSAQFSSAARPISDRRSLYASRTSIIRSWSDLVAASTAASGRYVFHRCA